MGRRGPPPKPTASKKLAGNPGKRPLNKREPKPTIKPPKPPAFLDALALAEWKRITPELLSLGLLSELDRAMLAAYCVACSELAEASETLASEGRQFETESGYLMPHPAVARQRSAWQAVLRFSQEFGLSPASRSRVSGANQEDFDPLLDG